ncbi:aldehyde dehydrogenase family protein, partial [Thauera sp. 63]|uniref:aldehyde dehydrogenase family protein n=1 Tax=Thauera sp. 63 TaxID=497321 RepID=UPI0002D01E12
AGVPAAALQLLPGRGETVGAALVADARIRGVMFTGSTEVAALINRSLAARGGNVPLIAETGGQNAMIVDSTALAEQVVADVLASSFDSAGQRCSALRVLCLQEDIAERVLHMLRGALDELRVGDPADVRTDIGPVIDAEAQAGLEAHVQAMKAKGARITRLPLPADCARGTFVAPTIIEIDALAELGREQFGPLLHVLRYSADKLELLIDTINASGYGLTMGVHTRIDETVEQVVARAHVGNLYVNRNMIGAVVGVQPFGGEGLSGTGPKAGGPLYLHRLLQRSPGPDLVNGALRVDHEASPALMDALLDWLDGAGRALLEGDELAVLRDRADAYRARKLSGLRLALPGPTGEDNSLRFVPRGTVAGLATSTPAALHQLLVALATGNRIVFDDTPLLRSLQQMLPEALRTQVALDARWPERDFGALLVDTGDDEAHAWHVKLAARPGPILPLLRPTPEYDTCRLVHERTVSINTAAAGGNASLMAMGA